MDQQNGRQPLPEEERQYLMAHPQQHPQPQQHQPLQRQTIHPPHPPPPDHISIHPGSVVSGVTLDRDIVNAKDDDIPSKMYLPPQIDEEELMDEPAENKLTVLQGGEEDEDVKRHRILTERYKALKQMEAQDPTTLHQTKNDPELNNDHQQFVMQEYPSRGFNQANTNREYTDDEELVRGVEQGQRLLQTYGYLAPQANGPAQGDQEVHTNQNENDMNHDDRLNEAPGYKTRGIEVPAEMIYDEGGEPPEKYVENQVHLAEQRRILDLSTIEKDFEMVPLSEKPWKDRYIIPVCCFLAGLAVAIAFIVLFNAYDLEIFGYELEIESSSTTSNVEERTIPSSTVPSFVPTASPTTPTVQGTISPSQNTITSPTTASPPPTTPQPALPTCDPSCGAPSDSPTSLQPTSKPTTSPPTNEPSSSPTTLRPTQKPATENPIGGSVVEVGSDMPTRTPTLHPSTSPSVSPSLRGSTSPPTLAPTTSPICATNCATQPVSVLDPNDADKGPAPTTATTTQSPTQSPTLLTPEPTTAGNNPLPTTSEPTGNPITDPPARSPSTSPTQAPTDPPSDNPTTSPTTSPTTPPQWQQVGGPFVGEGLSSGHGSAVAIAGGFMVSTEPASAGGVGQARLYKENPSWSVVTAFLDTNLLDFGSAVDLAVVSGKPSAVVGAKGTEDADNLASFGSASVFEVSNSGWSQLGSIIRPPFNVIESGGQFGSSVAMATDIHRIAVGAPESNRDGANLDTGRIYTYEFDGSDWQQMADPEIGSAGSKLGTSLDMSKDGSYMLGGAPYGRSGDGLVFYYRWDPVNSEWDEILPIFGSNREALGSSVAIISEDGSQIAFGGPDYGANGQGVVRVYSNFGGLFVQLGSDIVGLNNEKIGTTLSGAKGRIAMGTNNGSFRVYEWKGGWTEVATGPADLGSPVVSINLDEDGKRVAVGLASEKSLVFELG